MKKETLKELIASHRNIQTHIWTSAMVTISGSLTLVQNLSSITNKTLFILGLIVFFVLINIYLNKIGIIDNLIKKMENQDDK